MKRIRPALAVLSLFVGRLASGAEPGLPPPLAIPRTVGPVTVDGDLGDPGWKGAAVIDTFWETNPGNNVPPKVKTTAWVTYDDRCLYIAVTCGDPEPRKRFRAPGLRLVRGDTIELSTIRGSFILRGGRSS